MLIHALIATTALTLGQTSNSGVSPAGELPLVEVARDNTVIDKSCRVRIAPGLVIADADDNGVIHIAASNITVVFESGSMLRGSPAGTPPDTMTGRGIRIQNVDHVTLRDAVVSGFKVGVALRNAPDAELAGCRFTDNFRQHLLSTAEAEDPGDWLWPHDNTHDKWATRYGAAIHAIGSDRVSIHDCTVRKGQNGIILDSVAHARIYDNDCSFLSGWGLALWLVTDSQIQHNAFDFCIRGYSHGVYNRGQDSAGILVFERCTGNTFAQNSVTHGGDGFFAFSGKGALGEDPSFAPASFKGLGNADTLLTGNDFSYAAAHGIETTFSFNFTIAANRMVSNAICGVWGGYSQNMLITRNLFEDNGSAGYGLERGGINIEHGSGNVIDGNTFTNNACGVHLWWDDDPGIAKSPWYAANHKGSVGNAIVNNRFAGDKTGIQQRITTQTELSGNTFEGIAEAKQVVSDASSDTKGAGIAAKVVGTRSLTASESVGVKTPVGARANLRGRENILVGEWEPWDHQSPMVHVVSRSPAANVLEVLAPPADLTWAVVSGQELVEVSKTAGARPGSIRLRVTPKQDVAPYSLRITGTDLNQVFSGQLMATRWTVRVFPWTKDPRENLDAWRAESNGTNARQTTLDSLTLRYANGGPKSLENVPDFKDAPIGNDHFGTIATTTLRLPKGKWSISTLSDDGVRVLVDGKPVVENWTWHAPTRNAGEFESTGEGPTQITVEHFELDGYSTLEVSLTPAPAR